MKKTILIASLILSLHSFTKNVFAYNEIDLAKFNEINVCETCNLSNANLSGTYFHGANLDRADLRGVNFSEAILSAAMLNLSLIHI